MSKTYAEIMAETNAKIDAARLDWLERNDCQITKMQREDGVMVAVVSELDGCPLAMAGTIREALDTVRASPHQAASQPWKEKEGEFDRAMAYRESKEGKK